MNRTSQCVCATWRESSLTHHVEVGIVLQTNSDEVSRAGLTQDYFKDRSIGDLIDVIRVHLKDL